VKITLLLLLSITLSSCGRGAHTDANDSAGVTLTENLVSSCSVTKDTETLEIVISCPDGTEERLKDGVDGQDGTSCTIADVVGGAMITCAHTSVFIKDGVDGQDGSACSVVEAQNSSGSLISCADGTTAFIRNGKDGTDGQDGEDGADGQDGEDGTDGQDGEDGEDGADGQDGEDGTDGQDGEDGTDGQDGEDGEHGADGQDGEDGTDGQDGEDGTDGQDGEDGEHGADGQDGEDGTDGQDGLDFVQRVIDPCGQETTHGLDEVLLVLQSGDILAYYNDGQNQYLTILKRNKHYVTTDGTGCKFKVTKDGEIKD